METSAASPGTLLTPQWRRGWLILGLLCAASLLSALLMAAPPVWKTLYDVIVLLDGGWRVYHGQVPHQDFYSCLGPFPVGVLGLSFVLTGGHSPQLALALSLTGGVLALLAFIAAQGRLSRFWGTALALFILLLVTAPFALGMVHQLFPGFRYFTTYSEFYNRLGWAAIILAQFCVLYPRRNAGGGWLQSESLDGVIAGAACALAIFTKINYLIVAGFILGLALCRPRPGGRKQFVLGLVSGIVLVTVLLGLWPGGVFAYFQDTLTLLKVNRTESYATAFYQRTTGNGFWLLLLPFLTLAVLARARASTNVWQLPDQREQRRELVMAITVAIVTGLFLTLFNEENAPYPSLWLAGLFLVQLTQLCLSAETKNGQPWATDAYLRTFAIKTVVAAQLANFLFLNGGSILYSHFWLLKNPHWQNNSEALAGPVIKSIPIPVLYSEDTGREVVNQSIIKSSAPETSLSLTRWCNDGTELLARHIKPDDRVFVADWLNPFNLTLNIPPAKGGALLWDYERMVDDRLHPDPETTLHEITLFMVPKIPFHQVQAEFMLRTYGQSLGTDFVKTDESLFWTLWARKSSRNELLAPSVQHPGKPQ